MIPKSDVLKNKEDIVKRIAKLLGLPYLAIQTLSRSNSSDLLNILTRIEINATKFLEKEFLRLLDELGKRNEST